MKFYEVNHKYIDFLREHDPIHVMKARGDGYRNERKYIGIFEIDGLEYFAPISSAKNGKDYLLENNQVTMLKKNNIYVHYITENYYNQDRPLAKIMFCDLIPIPADQRKEVNFNEIKDEKYKSLVLKEYNYVKKHQVDLIFRHAKALHKAYEVYNGLNMPSTCPDFDLLKNAIQDWQMENVSKINEDQNFLAELYDMGIDDRVLDKIKVDLQYGSNYDDIWEKLDAGSYDEERIMEL